MTLSHDYAAPTRLPASSGSAMPTPSRHSTPAAPAAVDIRARSSGGPPGRVAQWG